MTKHLRIGFLTIAVCLCGAPASGENLIENGGFERPVVPDGTYRLFGKGQAFPGWQVVGDRGTVAVIGGNYTHSGIAFVPHRGDQWLDLTGISNTRTGVRQLVQTKPRQLYTLSFFVGNVYNPGGIFGVSSRVELLINGKRVRFAKNDDTSATQRQGWKKFSVRFEATDDFAFISFKNADPSDDNSNGLDSVTLQEFP